MHITVFNVKLIRGLWIVNVFQLKHELRQMAGWQAGSLNQKQLSKHHLAEEFWQRALLEDELSIR